MDIVFKGRHTDVPERFRNHAASKLARMEKLDQKVIRVDVEVTAERNPRQADRKERVELTITTRGPVIRAEAAAEDRYAALDLALGKLDSRLRRACDRRKDRHASAAVAAATVVPAIPLSRFAPEDSLAPDDSTEAPPGAAEKTVPVAMEGEGPLVVREKMHVACPMTIDQALFEMELVGHDFFLFTDTTDGLPSVVYRRLGYQYGVIRLVEDAVAPPGSLEARAGEHAAAAGR